MKKRYLFVHGATRWNNLLQKFNKIYKRIQLLINGDNFSIVEYSRLQSKINRIYHKLENMQGNIGLKLAGTSLVLMLSFVNSYAQDFTNAGLLNENISLSDFVSNTPSIDFGDIDEDGDVDIVTGNSAGTVTKLINDGVGNFSVGGTISSDNGEINVGQYSAPCLIDIDGDTHLDLLVGDKNGFVNYYKNDGTGNYIDMGKLQADGNNIDVGYEAKPTTCDLNGDGTNELYVGSTAYIYEFDNDGSGNFTANGTLETTSGSQIYKDRSAPSFADIDGDGDLDLYIGDYYSYVFVYKNDGTGKFVADGSFIGNGYYDRTTPDFADIDGDGDLDLYVGNVEGDGKISFYENDGSGNFSQQGNIQVGGMVPIQVFRSAAPTFVDLDGDGDLDLYVGDNENITHFENDGSNIFTRIDTLKADGNFIDEDDNRPIFADIDGDGDLDLYNGIYYNGIIVYLNDGSNNFSDNGNLQSDGTNISYDTYGHATPAFADFDNDGDLDLYEGNLDGKINIHTNNSGIFSSAGNLQSDGTDIDVGWYSAPAFGDIDNDGDLDLVVGNEDGNVYLYLNDGTNNFTDYGAIQVDGANVNVNRDAVISFFDYDNDNDLDIIIGNYDGNLRIIENNMVIETIDIINQPIEQLNICSNITVSFVIEADNVSSYQWQLSTDGGNTFNNISDNAEFSGTQTDSLNVVASSSTEGLYLCVLSGYNTEESNVVELSLDAIAPTITCVGNQTINIPAGQTQYTVSGSEFDPTSTSDNCAIASVENDFNSASTLDGELLPIGTTTIQWTVTDEQGNTDVCSLDIEVSTISGIAYIAENTFRIFPNPAKDQLTISNVEAYSNIQILDITGKLVKQYATEQFNSITINVSDLQNGVYFVKLQSNEINKTIKFVKE